MSEDPADAAAPSPSQTGLVPAFILVPWGLNMAQSSPLGREKSVQIGEQQDQGVEVAGGAS